MREITANPNLVVPLGRQGENQATIVKFPVSGWNELYGEGSFSLLHKRSGDVAPYPVTVEYENGFVIWPVTSADVYYMGYGTAQLMYIVGDAVAKSVIYKTSVLQAIDGGEIPEPTPSWIERVLEIGEQEEASQHIAEAWAVGKRGGVDVPDTDETYHNNSKWYAQEAQAAEEAIENLGVSAESLPVGSDASVTKTVDPETGAVNLGFGLPVGNPTDAQVAEATDAWLSENVAQETGYVLDRTLEMKNAAAPADMAGSMKISVNDIQVMASVNHSLRLPTDIASVNLTDPSAWYFADATVGFQKNVFDPVNRIHRDCIKITSTANGFAYCDLGTSVDATKKPVLLSVALDENYDIGNARGISLQLFSGNSRSSAYRQEIYIQFESDTAAYNYTYYQNGFFNLCFFSQSGQSLSTGNSFDPTDVTALGVHIRHTTGTRTAYVADLKFVEPMKKSGIVTIIDNFGLQVPDMADYAYSKGIRLNLSIIPAFYEGSSEAPPCASKSELDRVAAQGHLIWNHTYEHLRLNDLSDLQIADQINLAERWMNKNGFKDGAKYISIPSAQFDTDSFKSVMNTNAETVFHKWGFMGGYAYCPYFPCVRQLPTTYLDSQNDHDASTMISFAKKGLDNGGISIIGFHGTYWDNDNGVSWKAYIDGIAELENVYHYGLDEIFNGQWC